VWDSSEGVATSRAMASRLGKVQVAGGEREREGARHVTCTYAILEAERHVTRSW
jgi:hypothetical protein